MIVPRTRLIVGSALVKRAGQSIGRIELDSDDVDVSGA